MLERGADRVIRCRPIFFIIYAEILAIIVRNNDATKGINVDGQEYLISQYADDTSFILDGSSESLYGTINHIMHVYLA